MSADPYTTLGLTKTATAAEIKSAYRKLARRHHPDLHPDDTAAEARFKAISAAHDLLKDPATRARFDAGEIDAAGVERPPRQYYRDFAETAHAPFSGARGFGSAFGGGDPGDIFADILRQRGAGRDSGFPRQGQDALFGLEVEFLDAARGAEMRLSLGDTGSVAVKIPAGAQDGQTLRLRGKGAAGQNGGPPGDALITLTLRPHPLFRREGDDILLTLPITIDEAILGGKITAPTLSGPVSLTIPAGASSGRVLRLRGRGIARIGATPGDQRVELRIVAPPVIDDALRDFLTEWRKGQSHAPRAHMSEAAE
jgi:DnaJ-class molecular chaperone